MKYCPTCYRRFDNEATVCSFDETRLRREILVDAIRLAPTVIYMLLSGAFTLAFAVYFLRMLVDWYNNWGGVLILAGAAIFFGWCTLNCFRALTEPPAVGSIHKSLKKDKE